MFLGMPSLSRNRSIATTCIKTIKFTLILPTVVAVSIAVGILLGGVVFENTPPVPRRGNLVAPGSGKLNMLLSLIENRYVDTVSMDSITEKTIPFILEELDPHSVYVPAKDMAQMNESLDGEFDGIGVMFNMATDTVIVLNVINSGPSSKVGVLGGDRIITINDTIVAGMKMRQDEVMKRLRGPRGSKVKLGYPACRSQRPGADHRYTRTSFRSTASTPPT